MARKRTRRTIEDEVLDTEARDQTETVSVNISMPRGLYAHALRRLQAGDYSTISSFLADLIRRDKYARVYESNSALVTEIAMELGLPDIDPNNPDDRRRMGEKVLERLRRK